jgi:hypothetical protein
MRKICLFLLTVISIQFSYGQTALTLSITGSSNGILNHEPYKAIDKNTTTSYINDGQAYNPFYLTISFDRSVQAAKVRVLASSTGLLIKVNNADYTQTIKTDDIFYIVNPSLFNSITLYRNDFSATSCFEVEVTEIALNTVSMPLTYDAAGNNTYRKIVIGTTKSGVLDTTSTTQITYDSIDNQQITIYPNPTKGQLIIKRTLNIDDPDVYYSVYTMTGYEILVGKWDKEETLIDIENQPPGTYLLVLNQGQKKLTYTIIKQ